jgi:phosphate/sulfate permease
MEGMLDVWGAVLTKDPPLASPSAIPGMFAGEQYDEAQRHALFVFRYMLIFVAALQSFAHGANDTANATGASIGLYRVLPCSVDWFQFFYMLCVLV